MNEEVVKAPAAVGVLEVIGFDINGCVAAQNAGADRIELCANPMEGGTTPSYGLIKMARRDIAGLLTGIPSSGGGSFEGNSQSSGCRVKAKWHDLQTLNSQIGHGSLQ